jgi:hypothetical protein
MGAGACFAFCVDKVIGCFNKKQDSVPELEAPKEPTVVFGDMSKEKKIEVLVYDEHGILIIKKWMKRPKELIIGKDPHNTFFKDVTMRNQFGHIVGKNIGWYHFDVLVFADDEVYDAIKKHYEKIGIYGR